MTNAQYQLQRIDNRLTLHLLDHSGKPQKTGISVDFTTGKQAYRQRRVSAKQELIGRAVGAHKKPHLHIIDATAGLGKDAFVLAQLGCQVTLLERANIVHDLLADGLKRAQQHPSSAAAAQRMQLFHVDSLHWLQNTPTNADVIYLDPMYPSKQKSAQAKKDMHTLQQILGNTDNSRDLFTAARHTAVPRIVVKRPLRGEYLNNQTPHHSISGSSTRFDIYLTVASTTTKVTP